MMYWKSLLKWGVLVLVVVCVVGANMGTPAPVAMASAPRQQPANPCPGYMLPRLAIGGQGIVSSYGGATPNNIRTQPESPSIVGQIPVGGVFAVIGGPVCTPATRIVWWQVNYNGITGWTGEGQNGIYWVEPYAPGAVVPAQPVQPVVVPVQPGGVVVSNASSCVGYLTPRLVTGQWAMVTPGLPNRIRTQPESPYVVGKIPGGSVFMVLDGPVCTPTTRIAWWKVEYNGITGWTAEGANGVYWLVPLGPVTYVPQPYTVIVSSSSCLGFLPPRLSIGGQGIITPGLPNRIRALPESSNVIGQIPVGGIFTVLDGPVCLPTMGMVWWKAYYNGIIGWTAESNRSEYWIEPYGTAPAPVIEVGPSVSSAAVVEGRDDFVPYVESSTTIDGSIDAGSSGIVGPQPPSQPDFGGSVDAGQSGPVAPQTDIGGSVDAGQSGPVAPQTDIGGSVDAGQSGPVAPQTDIGGSVDAGQSGPVAPQTGSSTAGTCTMTPLLQVGSSGWVSDNEPNRLRAEPGSAKVMTSIPPGGVFSVLDGPVCTPNGVVWWQVDYNGVIGWTAEGQHGEYWLSPYAQ